MLFKNLLYQYQIARPLNVTGDKYGIELELEGRDLPYVGDSSQWVFHEDNSLRRLPECGEFVSRPLSLKGCKAALRELQDLSIQKGTVVKHSIRTSYHVHRNVLDLHISQIASIVTLYILLETSLYSICGPHRKGNVFCQPINDCNGHLFELRNFFTSCEKASPYLYNLRDNGRKYIALNTKSMFEKGTVEFRAHEGTFDIDRILHWVTVIDRLVEYAKYHSPISIIEQVSACNSLKSFGDEVFGDLTTGIIFDENSKWDNMSNAQIIAYGSEWNIDEFTDKPVEDDVVKVTPLYTSLEPRIPTRTFNIDAILR